MTIPPTTRVTVAPTTTVAAPTTTTTAPPTTTTTAPPPPAGDGPSLVAVTPKNQPSGPPGGGLQVSGGGYTCPTVYLFFDGGRVGSTSPDAAGRISKSGLSVPGDAGDGTHRVTASCDPAGDTIETASLFEVLPVSVHRPAFVTSLPMPGQVSLDPGALLATGAIAVGAIMLIAFPFELFNSAMEENYDEIRGWFGMGPRGVPEVKTRGGTLGFLALTAVTAVATGFLSPDFGFNRTSVVLFLGICVALLVMAVLFSLPADIGIRRQFGEWGKLNFLPGSLIVTIAMVAACRIFEFQPGFFYGALAGLAFRSALSPALQGKMTAANWMFSLAISVGAFFLRVPVSAAAAEPGSQHLVDRRGDLPGADLPVGHRGAGRRHAAHAVPRRSQGHAVEQAGVGRPVLPRGVRHRPRPAEAGERVRRLDQRHRPLQRHGPVHPLRPRVRGLLGLLPVPAAALGPGPGPADHAGVLIWATGTMVREETG